jgi:hypothetical protein
VNDLIKFWESLNSSVPPFIHPGDQELLETEPRLNFQKYINGKRFDPRVGGFHFSLFPVPYAGDLQNAKIVILLLNPGFNYSDYWAEYESRGFRSRLKRNLAQEFGTGDFPFMFLDPQFCWHTGFHWWEKKLRSVACELVRKRKAKNYLEALRCLSKNIACIELIPYHSASFQKPRLIKTLPSAEAARSFVQERLRPMAEKGKKTLIVTRNADGWGFEKARVSKELRIYSSGHARGAHLGTNTDGGKAILSRLLN